CSSDLLRVLPVTGLRRVHVHHLRPDRRAGESHRKRTNVSAEDGEGTARPAKGGGRRPFASNRGATRMGEACLVTEATQPAVHSLICSLGHVGLPVHIRRPWWRLP